MADIKKYRQIIQDLFMEIHRYGCPAYYSNGVEQEIVFDTERDRYFVIDVGWHQKEYVYETLAHIDIKDGKIWIQLNNTDIDFVAEFIESGIPKENIVDSINSPFASQISNCAVGEDKSIFVNIFNHNNNDFN